MTRLIFSFLCILCSTAALAQHGTISGTVTTKDGQPAINVTISIEHTKLGSISDAQGAYVITNVKPGTWTLRITSIGAATQQQTVTIAAGQVQQLHFTLQESAAAE